VITETTHVYQVRVPIREESTGEVVCVVAANIEAALERVPGQVVFPLSPEDFFASRRGPLAPGDGDVGTSSAPGATP
jgi:hypothetical protein